MAYSLRGERPVTAAASRNPVLAFVAWAGNLRAKYTQRVALSELLELDNERLADLGLERADIIDVLQNRTHRNPGRALNARRARAAHDWLAHP